MSGSCVHQKTLQCLPLAPPQLRGLIACVQGRLWYSAALWSWIRLQGKEQYEKVLWEASTSHFTWELHLSWGLHACTLQSYVAGKPAPDWLDFLAWCQTRLIIMGLFDSHSTAGWPWLTSPDLLCSFCSGTGRTVAPVGEVTALYLPCGQPQLTFPCRAACSCCFLTWKKTC